MTISPDTLDRLFRESLDGINTLRAIVDKLCVDDEDGVDVPNRLHTIATTSLGNLERTIRLLADINREAP